MVFTSLSCLRLKALMVFTSLSCAISQCLGTASSVHLQMLFPTYADDQTVADSSVCVCVIFMKGIVKTVCFVCICLQIKSSSNNKGPYDFSQPNLLQELNGEHTVSLPPHGCSQTPLQLKPVPQNLGQLRRWPHLRYPIAERSGHGHAAAASSKLQQPSFTPPFPSAISPQSCTADH